MSISDRSRKAMEDLGMTGYEIRVYTSLLETGAMTAADISKKSGVPYSKIYEVLNSLEDKGWLESDSSRPQKFFPKSPSTALEAMRMRSENNFRDSQAAIVSELMPMYTKSGIKEKPEIWVVRGLYNIAAKVGEIVQSCQQELLVALPSVAQEVAKPMQPVLRTMHEKGVKISVLASEDTSADIIKALSRVSEVRQKNGMFGGGVIGDGKHVMILLGESMGENGVVDPIAIWADHAALAGFAKDYFEYLWEDAVQAKKADK
ncbi:TrmB family transcriptional regulator [Candidatus Nitrososphaera sp. FF02]|uniref:TrmB family transcriptional regulator n=1 Tax=Candidatus Nitrososphaera sp. FF02 TaxID=3398226 RepID=UPI0039EC8770